MRWISKISQWLNKNKLIRFSHLAIAPALIFVWLLFGASAFEGKDLALIALSFFLIDNLGLQIGFHKLLAHRSFKTGPFWTGALSFLGCFAGQGSPLVWAGIHRAQHHPFADTERDPHSPQKGFFYSFIGWYWDIKNIKLNSVKDLLNFKSVCFFHKHYVLIIWSVSFALYLAFGFKALVLLILIPMTLSLIFIGLINTGLHSPKKSFWDYILLAYRSHQTEDHSKNSAVLGLLTAGLGYHNNHHASPEKFNYGEKWHELDISRFIIPLLARFAPRPAKK